MVFELSLGSIAQRETIAGAINSYILELHSSNQERREIYRRENTEKVKCFPKRLRETAGMFFPLLRTTLDDMLDSACLQSRVVRAVTTMILIVPATCFAVRMLFFDRKIGIHGLSSASRWLLQRYYQGVRWTGSSIPPEGAVLIVSNHPGLGDSLSLLSHVERNDLKIVTLRREFFRRMPRLSCRCILLGESARLTGEAVRRMTGHLRHGGALLLYPSGIIEDDPMVPSELPHTPAVWSDLTGMLAVLGGPGVVVCTILVGRVSSAAAVANRWVRRGKTADVRSKRASLLSLLLRMTRSQYVEIRSGAPVTIGVLPDERKRRAYYGGVTAVIRSRLYALANFCKN